jgi:hypothetical protein
VSHCVMERGRLWQCCGTLGWVVNTEGRRVSYHVFFSLTDGMGCRGRGTRWSSCLEPALTGQRPRMGVFVQYCDVEGSFSQAFLPYHTTLHIYEIPILSHFRSYTCHSLLLPLLLLLHLHTYIHLLNLTLICPDLIWYLSFNRTFTLHFPSPLNSEYQKLKTQSTHSLPNRRNPNRPPPPPIDLEKDQPYSVVLVVADIRLDFRGEFKLRYLVYLLYLLYLLYFRVLPLLLRVPLLPLYYHFTATTTNYYHH